MTDVWMMFWSNIDPSEATIRMGLQLTYLYPPRSTWTLFCICVHFKFSQIFHVNNGRSSIEQRTGPVDLFMKRKWDVNKCIQNHEQHCNRAHASASIGFQSVVSYLTQNLKTEDHHCLHPDWFCAGAPGKSLYEMPPSAPLRQAVVLLSCKQAKTLIKSRVYVSMVAPKSNLIFYLKKIIEHTRPH